MMTVMTVVCYKLGVIVSFGRIPCRLLHCRIRV